MGNDIPFREAAVWITVCSALAYLCGSLYVESYYARLGLPETELSFDVPYIMSQSFMALMLPAFWVAIVAAACRLFSSFMPLRPPEASVFFPIPAVKAIAYTLCWCALAQCVLALGAGPEPTWFFGWGISSTIILALAAGAFTATFYFAKRRQQAKVPPRITRSTASTAALLGIAISVGVLQLLTGPHRWPFAAWQNWFIGISIVVIVVMAIREAKQWENARENAKEWQPPNLRGELLHPSATIFLAVLAFLALLLAAGMSGMAAGRQVIESCQAQRTVQFDPPPPGATNETYLLLLHQQGAYYVRGNTSSVRIFQDDPSFAAQLGWRMNPGCD